MSFLSVKAQLIEILGKETSNCQNEMAYCTQSTHNYSN